MGLLFNGVVMGLQKGQHILGNIGTQDQVDEAFTHLSQLGVVWRQASQLIKHQLIEVIVLEKTVIAAGGDDEPRRNQQVGLLGNPRQIRGLAAGITGGGGR
ncbi:MAG: hypothetical protein R6X23_05875 [Acidimicrobiia bacterium]